MKEIPNFKWQEYKTLRGSYEVCTINDFELYAYSNGAWELYT